MINRQKIVPIDKIPSLYQSPRYFHQQDLNLENNDEINLSNFKLQTKGNILKVTRNKSLFQTADYNVEVAIQTEIQQQQKESKQEKQDKIKRIKISIFMFVLVMFVSLALPIPFLFYFVTIPMDVTNIMILTFSSVLAVVIFTNIFCIMGFRNIKVICQYMFMLDDIMLTILGAIASMIGMLYLFQGFMTQSQMILGWITSMANIFSIFTIAVNFRIMIRFCQLSCCQIVIYKLVLMLDSMSYVIIGCYVYISDYSPTQGYDPAMDNRILNFILLYIFSLVSLYVQLYSKISDFDGTGDLLPRYHFEDSNDSQLQSLKSEQQQYQQNTNNNLNNVDQ